MKRGVGRVRRIGSRGSDCSGGCSGLRPNPGIWKLAATFAPQMVIPPCLADLLPALDKPLLYMGPVAVVLLVSVLALVALVLVLLVLLLAIVFRGRFFLAVGDHFLQIILGKVVLGQ